MKFFLQLISILVLLCRSCRWLITADSLYQYSVSLKVTILCIHNIKDFMNYPPVLFFTEYKNPRHWKPDYLICWEMPAHHACSVEGKLWDTNQLHYSTYRETPHFIKTQHPYCLTLNTIYLRSVVSTRSATTYSVCRSWRHQRSWSLQSLWVISFSL